MCNSIPDFVTPKVIPVSLPLYPKSKYFLIPNFPRALYLCSVNSTKLSSIQNFIVVIASKFLCVMYVQMAVVSFGGVHGKGKPWKIPNQNLILGIELKTSRQLDDLFHSFLFCSDGICYIHSCCWASYGNTEQVNISLKIWNLSARCDHMVTWLFLLPDSLLNSWVSQPVLLLCGCLLK